MVLDDDPTGTQTVHSVPVVTTPDAATLVEAVTSNQLVYVLTNSRALGVDEAASLAAELGRILREVSDTSGLDLKVISRSDSTLRGHYPAEVSALVSGGDLNVNATILILAFPGSGRITWADCHWVLQGDTFVPVAATEYARDPHFSYSSSWMPGWIEERSSGSIRSSNVESISIEDVRLGGLEHVAEKLGRMSGGVQVVANCVTDSDIRLIAEAVRLAEMQGSRFVYRSAASFVSAYGQIPPRSQLTRDDLLGDDSRGGLVVCGSYVPLSSRQVVEALNLPDVFGVEVSVADLVSSPRSFAAEVARVSSKAATIISRGQCALVYTSRTFSDVAAASSIVTRALVEVTKNIKEAASCLIAKGGITSAATAASALGWKLAWVEGQIAPGVPVWSDLSTGLNQEPPLVVFPGNVGDDTTLADVIVRLALSRR